MFQGGNRDYNSLHLLHIVFKECLTPVIGSNSDDYSVSCEMDENPLENLWKRPEQPQ